MKEPKKVDVVRATFRDVNNETDWNALERLMTELTQGKRVMDHMAVASIFTAPHEVYVARDPDAGAPQFDGQILGMVIVTPNPLARGKVVRIDDLVVFEEYQRRTIGEQLFRAAVDEAKSLRADQIEVIAEVHRFGVRGLCTNLGFSKIDYAIFRLDIKH